MPEASGASWPIAVFAHNEAAHIKRCLDCLADGARERMLDVYVLANGCTDGTEEAVAAYSNGRANVHLVKIALGDKANAWNHYVHSLAVESDVHFFLDGDCRTCPEALDRLYSALQVEKDAHAAAAYPAGGRSVERWTRSMQNDGWLAGNLYALRGSFVNRMRDHNVRLPIGWIIEDGLVGALVKWDLDPKGNWDSRRIAACTNACFAFDSLQWNRSSDWKLYWRRRVRYSEGFFQNRMLRSFVKNDGLSGIPATAEELYRRVGTFPHARFGSNYIFDLFALKRMRQKSSLTSFGVVAP